MSTFEEQVKAANKLSRVHKLHVVGDEMLLKAQDVLAERSTD